MICSPIPVAQIGEIYYSPIIREAVTTGKPVKNILRGINGPKRFPAMISGIPCRVNRLSRSMPAAHPLSNPQELLEKNTLFPYYVHFDTEEQYQAALNTLESDRESTVFLSLGLAAYQSGSYAKFPRYCEQCAEHDWRNPGVAYFHREHQLPGVAVCYLHETVLIDGCKVCGHYPLSDLKQSMPGWCHCLKQTQPMRLIGDDIPLHPGIVWIAKQSAYLLSAARSTTPCVYSRLRGLMFAKGYCKGSLLDYSAIANALEERFSRVNLERMNYPAWIGSRPSAWVRRYFKDSPGRRPTLEHLLLIGTVANSIEEFESSELALGTPPEDGVAACESVSEDSKKLGRSELEAVLKANQYRIDTSAKQLKTTSNQLARSALNHGIRVPLRAKKWTGANALRLDEICTSLSCGEPLELVMKKHNVGEWTITRILLDSPELFRKRSAERTTATLRAHRRTLSEALTKEPSITRKEFQEKHPGAYDYLVKLDSLWWSQQISRAKRRWAPKANRDQCRDKQLVKRISNALEEFKTMKRPVRVTSSSLLKRAGVCYTLSEKLDRYPLTHKLISENCEGREEFHGRKIRWAVAAMAAKKVPISVHTLKRHAAIDGKFLKPFAQLVINSAKEYGAQIQNSSFFAMSRV